MMRLQVCADGGECFLHLGGKMKQLEFGVVNSAGADHVPPVYNLVPIFPSVDKNQVMRRELIGLHECEHFPEFVHGAEAAGKNNQSFGHLREPELAHKKIVKKEIQLGRDI